MQQHLKKQPIIFSVILIVIIIFAIFIIILYPTITLKISQEISFETKDNNQQKTKKTIKVNSVDPQIQIILDKTKTKWFLEKTNKINLWKENSVILYKAPGVYSNLVTVKNLKIIFTNREQPLFKTISTVDEKKYVYESFGESYNPQTQELTLVIFFDRKWYRIKNDEELSNQPPCAKSTGYERPLPKS